jgi:transcriptional regulator with XRE-family HTH domain
MGNGADGGTDLGRRIEAERDRAGLSRSAAAKRAGMSPEYLAYLETSPVPNPSQATIARLAGALGVPSSALSGAGMEEPPGRSGAAGHPVLETLTAAECRSHLAPGGIGRFLYVEDRGPVAVPVNYAMLGDDVVFRADDRIAAAGTAGDSKVSFDVDHFDDVLSEGWSVLVSGTAVILTRPQDVQAAERLGIEPWAGQGSDTYVRLTPAETTGRRIRAGSAA